MKKRKFVKIFSTSVRAISDRLRGGGFWNTLTAVSVRPVKLDIYRTAIPMRSFEHAAAVRELAEAIIVRLEMSDGTVGWGETLPRKYVTGETPGGVIDDLTEILWPAWRKITLSKGTLGDVQGLHVPAPNGRCINAATCAIELAFLWGVFRPLRRCSIRARVSGVLGSADPARTARRLRMMRWFGLRDFKLKLGFGDDTDTENLRIVQKRIGKAIQTGKCTLRVDVNGGWDADQTPDRVAAIKPFGV